MGESRRRFLSRVLAEVDLDRHIIHPVKLYGPGEA